jgi:hypothetical protein
VGEIENNNPKKALLKERITNDKLFVLRKCANYY